jgi:outer membrane protein TolC
MNTQTKIMLSALVLFFALPLFGQQTIDLQLCRTWARENFPKLKQAELFQTMANLKKENLKTNYLPQIDLKGQATYQSETMEINIPIPGFQFDPVSKDQYKVYLDVKQTIWDGGITKSQKEMEQAGLETDVQRIELEVYQVYKLVDAYFFNVLMIDKNLEVFKAQQQLLQSQVERMKNANQFGAARQKDLQKLEAEKLQLDQKVVELQSSKKGILKVMEVLTGKPFEATTLAQPTLSKASATEFIRPEMKLFNLQQNQVTTSNKLLQAAQNPLFFGFGQAGYGKPGFNMLKNEFSPYYIVGVGLSWRVLDWNSTRRKIQLNDEQTKNIALLKTDFEQKQQMQLADAEEQINKIAKLIESDDALLKLRKSIAETASSELENGTITATDYLVDLNAQTVAQISTEIHKLQLLQATANYNSILGY